MWEDVTVVVACLGFVAALALIVVELRSVTVQAADAHVTPPGTEHGRS